MSADARRDVCEPPIPRAWFTVARIIGIAVGSLMLGLAAAGFVAGLRNWELIGSRSIYDAITAAGLPVTATTVVGLVVPHMVFATIGVAILVRRPSDRFAMVFALALVAPTTFRPLIALERVSPALNTPIEAVWLLAVFLTLITPFIFPDGHFVPSWTRFTAIAAIPAAVMLSAPMRAIMLLPDLPAAGEAREFRRGVMILSAFVIAGFAAQIYRYRHVSDYVQRQQVKLVGFSVSLLLSVFLVGFLIPSLFIDTANPWFAWAMLATVPLFLLVAVAVAIAILRYHLFAIDHIISRTLAYASLSLVLAAVYIATTVLLGQLAGGRSDLSVAGATLAVAVVFRPARQRLQGAVDRRFNRRKYDAIRTLDEFGDHLRREFDVDALERQLLNVVQDTLEPTRTSLWRVDPAAKR